MRCRLQLTVTIPHVILRCKWGMAWHCPIPKIKKMLGKFCSASSYSTESVVTFLFIWRSSPHWARASSFTRFLDRTHRHTTVGRTPLDEWSARHRDLYLTTHNIHNRQTSMPPVGFEPTISAGEWPQTYALDRAATGTGAFTFTL